MRRTRISLALGLALFTSATILTSSPAGIVGSKHDFSRIGGESGNKICTPCHTPYRSSEALAMPIWNAGATEWAYDLYVSGAGRIRMTPHGAKSQLCLSCHDGTIARIDCPDSFKLQWRWSFPVDRLLECTRCHRTHEPDESAMSDRPGTESDRFTCTRCHLK